MNSGGELRAFTLQCLALNSTLSEAQHLAISTLFYLREPGIKDSLLVQFLYTLETPVIHLSSASESPPTLTMNLSTTILLLTLNHSLLFTGSSIGTRVLLTPSRHGMILVSLQFPNNQNFFTTIPGGLLTL